MAFKLDRRLLPVKAHYFFFFASMGCLIGQINVIGRQLGISTKIMGVITAILPLSSTLAKPTFGAFADHFWSHRKTIFLVTTALASIFLSSLYFAQTPDGYEYHPEAYQNETKFKEPLTSDINFYSSIKFWSYAMFALLGSVFFHIVSSISDAICFDVLGENQNMKYGAQRLWGAVGYGIAALISGLLIDYSSPDPNMKNYLWVSVLCLGMCLIDLCCCFQLKLPSMHRSETAIAQLQVIFSNIKIWIFLGFSALAGILDSFMLFFLFWYLEEMAVETGDMPNIKIIEGLSAAAECFGSEILVFAYSGKIIKALGYRHSLSLSLFSYGIRYFLISFIQNPWQNIVVSVIFQGPTYALCHTSIIGRAAALAPAGLSATLQGVVAGVYMGLGYCSGSLLVGMLYGSVGGRWTLRILGSVAFIAAAVHILLTITVFKIDQSDSEKIKESTEDRLFKEQTEKLTTQDIENR